MDARTASQDSNARGATRLGSLHFVVKVGDSARRVLEGG